MGEGPYPHTIGEESVMLTTVFYHTAGIEKAGNAWRESETLRDRQEEDSYLQNYDRKEKAGRKVWSRNRKKRTIKENVRE